MENPALREIARTFIGERKKHETFNLAQTIQRLPTELQTLLSAIQIQAGESPLESDYEGCLKAFQAKRNKRQLKEITARILKAESANDMALKQQLLAEKQKLLTS